MVAERYQVGRVALLATLVVDIVPHLCRRGYRVTHSRGIPTTWLSVGGTLHVNHHVENGRSHRCRSVHFKCRPVIVSPAGSESACGYRKIDSGLLQLFSSCDGKRSVRSIVLEWQKRAIVSNS